MRILLTNDDGIHAQGLWALHAALAPGHEVTVVAPDRERTGVGHAITLHQPLRTASLAVNGAEGYAVNGTPADCVKLAVLEILGGRPDRVVRPPRTPTPGPRTGKSSPRHTACRPARPHR